VGIELIIIDYDQIEKPTTLQIKKVNKFQECVVTVIMILSQAISQTVGAQQTTRHVSFL
jgi:hypothetical protein